VREANHYLLDKFLKDIEKRAFRMAQLATRSEAEALDIVQETMIKLVTKYADKAPEEWRALFFKILENQLLDWHRKQKVMRKLFFWRKPSIESDVSEDAVHEAIDHHQNIESQLISEQLGEQLLSCIASLPLKQQQCFILRSWEGLTIKETAQSMQINENSVKTHYSRAVAKLKLYQTEYENR
jgi:RNA polymerase sigma-70 factor (ECF subfamily)